MNLFLVLRSPILSSKQDPNLPEGTTFQPRGTPAKHAQQPYLIKFLMHITTETMMMSRFYCSVNGSHLKIVKGKMCLVVFYGRDILN